MTTLLFLQSCDVPRSPPTDPYDALPLADGHLGVRPTTQAANPSQSLVYLSP
jgi:hypothetical protein